MADQSQTFVQMSLFDTDGAISLPGSADGNMPCNLLDGQITGSYGLGRAPVNHIPWQVSGKGTPTSETSGPTSSGSSASAALTQSLANRLRQRLATVGSMEYRQTWKEKATPSGRVFWAHTASVPRTSDKDYSGWPTPQIVDDNLSRTQDPEYAQRYLDRPNSGSSLAITATLTGWPSPKSSNATGAGTRGEGGENLQTVAQFAGWNTPRATDGTNGGPNQAGGALPADANLAGWPTPDSHSGSGGRVSKTPQARTRPSGTKKQLTINDAAQLAGWVTTGAHDAGTPNEGRLKKDRETRDPNLKGNYRMDLHDQVGLTLTSSPAETEKRGVLNPGLSLWLMGFPPEWLEAGMQSK